MPRLVKRAPKYRLHRPSGQAVVTLDQRDHYLGRFNSKASRKEYDRLVGEWMANGRSSPLDDQNEGFSVAELSARYLIWAKAYYVKNGRPTRSIERVKVALRALLANYADVDVSEFGPLSLLAVQQSLVDTGIGRTYVNDLIFVIRHAFKFGVRMQLVPVAVHQALETVESLRKGRSTAREGNPVRPVDDAMVDATLLHVPPVVADIIRFQRLTGCRPGEALSIRPADVDRSGEVWEYTPREHKTEHEGCDRTVYIGPAAQKILAPYLLRGPNDFCFSPAESERRRIEKLRATRKTPVQPSQKNRQKRSPKHKPGDRYTKDAYAWAIRRGCDRAFPVDESLSADEQKQWRREHRWSPNRLRHTAATRIRKQHGLEAAQVILGHSRADVTQIYAEANRELGHEVAAACG